jgi:hypothetical protein
MEPLFGISQKVCQQKRGITGHRNAGVLAEQCQGYGPGTRMKMAAVRSNTSFTLLWHPVEEAVNLGMIKVGRQASLAGYTLEQIYGGSALRL